MRRIAALLAIALLLTSASTATAEGGTRVHVAGRLLGGDRIVLTAVELPSGEVIGNVVYQSVRGTLRATVDCIVIEQDTDGFTLAALSGLVVSGDLTAAGDNFFFSVRDGHTAAFTDAASSFVLRVPSTRPCLRDFTGSAFPENTIESGRIVVTAS